MKVIHTIATVGVVVGGLAAVGGVFASGAFLQDASALEYQDSVDVEFTFNPTLSVTLSDSSVSISNLVPGTSATSVTSGVSALTITTTTNNIAGYTLRATVGGTGAGASNSTSLVNGGATLASIAHESDSANYVTSIPTNGSGVWGYSTDLGSHFNGFANTADAVILKTTSAPTGTVSGDTITTFDIGAYAPSTQAGGTYTNVVNFTTVTNVVTP